MLTWRLSSITLLLAGTLVSCSSALDTPHAAALPQSSVRTANRSQTQDVNPLTLKLDNCVAPATCSSLPNRADIIFHGPAQENPKIVATPQEAGYPYGYAVEFCLQATDNVNGYETVVGDALSECRNVTGFIDALDLAIDPQYPSATQSLEFFGDGLATPSPTNPIYDSLSFPVYANGLGLPQNQRYGFAVKLHIHDADGHFTALHLQWCPTTSCDPL